MILPIECPQQFRDAISFVRVTQESDTIPSRRGHENKFVAGGTPSVTQHVADTASLPGLVIRNGRMLVAKRMDQRGDKKDIPKKR